MQIHQDEWARVRQIAEANRSGAPLVLSSFLAGLESMARNTPSALIELLDMLQRAEAEAASLRAELDEANEVITYLKSQEPIAELQAAVRHLRAADAQMAALKEKTAAWEAIAGGMADVIRARGEALEPFARFARALDGAEPDSPDDTTAAWNRIVRITLGDLRRAAEVVHEKSTTAS